MIKSMTKHNKIFFISLMSALSVVIIVWIGFCFYNAEDYSLFLEPVNIYNLSVFSFMIMGIFNTILAIKKRDLDNACFYSKLTVELWFLTVLFWGMGIWL